MSSVPRVVLGTEGLRRSQQEGKLGTGFSNGNGCVLRGGANKNKFNTYKISRERDADADFWACEASSMPTLV